MSTNEIYIEHSLLNTEEVSFLGSVCRVALSMRLYDVLFPFKTYSDMMPDHYFSMERRKCWCHRVVCIHS